MVTWLYLQLCNIYIYEWSRGYIYNWGIVIFTDGHVDFYNWTIVIFADGLVTIFTIGQLLYLPAAGHVAIFTIGQYSYIHRWSRDYIFLGDHQN
jgi:hypothetical protein